MIHNWVCGHPLPYATLLKRVLHLIRDISSIASFCILGSPAPQSQPQAAGQTGDLQAQWAEYYRSLGYAYYGQQGGAQSGVPAQAPVQAQSQPPAIQPVAQPPSNTANGEQKVSRIEM